MTAVCLLHKSRILLCTTALFAAYLVWTTQCGIFVSEAQRSPAGLSLASHTTFFGDFRSLHRSLQVGPASKSHSAKSSEKAGESSLGQDTRPLRMGPSSVLSVFLASSPCCCWLVSVWLLSGSIGLWSCGSTSSWELAEVTVNTVLNPLPAKHVTRKQTSALQQNQHTMIAVTRSVNNLSDTKVNVSSRERSDMQASVLPREEETAPCSCRRHIPGLGTMSQLQ